MQQTLCLGFISKNFNMFWHKCEDIYKTPLATNIGNNSKKNKKWNIQGPWNRTIVLNNKNHKGYMLQMLQSQTMACNN
jgi:hypothetical protein